MLKNLRKKSTAQSLVEYGLILALVSIVAIAVLQTMGSKIQNTVNSVNTKLQTAQNQAAAQQTP